VNFTWHLALGTEGPMTQRNLKFKLLNILYNLAALYSQLVASANRGSADELKSACNNFCLAARVIFHVKTTVLPELCLMPVDMDMVTLESL
jgi:programmed cell death 6-interacting protein